MNFNGKLGAAIIGLIGASIAAYKYFFKSDLKIIDRQTTVKIIKQIKYQMMTSCVTFAQAVQNTVLPKLQDKNKQQVTSHLQAQIIKVFEQKQRLILSKYATRAQQLTHALEKTYKNDKELHTLSNDIEAMMEQAIKGIFPDITVPDEMKKDFDKNRVFKIFQDMLILISKSIVKIIFEQIEKNPDFNIHDNEEFLKVIRSINIYDIKNGYLQKEGLNVYPGNLNQNFFKLVQNYKKVDNEFKNLMKQINAHYQKFVEQLPDQYQHLNDQIIENDFKMFKLKSSVVEITKKTSHLVEKEEKKVIQPVVQQVPLDIIDDFDWVNIQNMQQYNKAQEVPVPKNGDLQKSYKQQLWWDVQPEVQQVHVPHQSHEHKQIKQHHGPSHVHKDHQHEHVKHAHIPNIEQIKNVQTEKKVEQIIEQKIQQIKEQGKVNQQNEIKNIQEKVIQSQNQSVQNNQVIIQQISTNQNSQAIQQIQQKPAQNTRIILNQQVIIPEEVNIESSINKVDKVQQTLLSQNKEQIKKEVIVNQNENAQQKIQDNLAATQ